MIWWDIVAVIVLVYLPWPWGVASNIQNLREQLSCHSHTQGTNSFLWQVRRHPPAYFLGTIHVPYTRVWDYIPQNTKVAFQQSENIFVELDLTDPNTMTELANCQLLPNGETLSDVLPHSLYRRLKTHLQYVKRMMPQWLSSDQRGRAFYADYLFEAIVGNWERKRPIWVMLVIDSLTEADIKSREIPVLDLYLAQEAARLNKRTGAVEQVEEQCVPLNGLNFTQEIFALNQTLWHQESLRAGTIRQTATLEDLIWHYNCGDLNLATFSQDTAQVPSMQNSTLTTEEIDLANQIDRYFRHELIYKRNRRMAMRVKAILEAKPKQSFFFALGTGHFLGNHTVFDFLRKAGVEVFNVPTDTPLNSSKSSLSSVDGSEGEQTSEGSSRKHRKRDRRRKKKRQRIGEPDIGHVISVPVPVRAENNRQFNELWIPLDRISDIPTSRSPDKKDGVVTAMPTQIYAAHNLPSVSADNGGSRLSTNCILYLAFSLHIVLYILNRIDR